MQHDTWGKATTDTLAGGFVRVPFGFAGGIYDEDTKLVRFGAREYDPETGRWLSKDEARFGGGWNFYEYAISDPVNFVDLTGRTPKGQVIGAAVGGAIGGAYGFGVGAGGGVLVGGGVGTVGGPPGVLGGAAMGGGAGGAMGALGGAAVGVAVGAAIGEAVSNCWGSLQDSFNEAEEEEAKAADKANTCFNMDMIPGYPPLCIYQCDDGTQFWTEGEVHAEKVCPEKADRRKDAWKQNW